MPVGGSPWSHNSTSTRSLPEPSNQLTRAACPRPRPRDRPAHAAPGPGNRALPPPVSPNQWVVAARRLGVCRAPPPPGPAVDKFAPTTWPRRAPSLPRELRLADRLRRAGRYPDRSLPEHDSGASPGRIGHPVLGGFSRAPRVSSVPNTVGKPERPPRARGLRDPHDPRRPVVIGDRRARARPSRAAFFGQLLGMARRPVADEKVRMQLQPAYTGPPVSGRVVFGMSVVDRFDARSPTFHDNDARLMVVQQSPAPGYRTIHLPARAAAVRGADPTTGLRGPTTRPRCGHRAPPPA